MAIQEDAVVANVILHQQRTALALILADNDAEEEKLADSIFAEYITEHNRAIAPGRGHMDPGYRAKQGNIPLFINHGLLDSFLIDDTRCMNMLGLTLREYRRFSQLFDAAVRARNDFCEKKPTVSERLRILLMFIRYNITLRAMEAYVWRSKPQIQVDLSYCAVVLIEVLKATLGETFPNLQQRNEMRNSCLPDIIKHTGLFFIVDGMKHTNVNSIHRRRNFKDKGFGASFIHITDLLGRTIDIAGRHSPGNTHDLIQYHSSDFFMQTRNNHQFGINETGIGDSAYVGPANKIGSTDLLQKYPDVEIQRAIDNGDYDLALYMDEWNRSLTLTRVAVERNIGGAKIDSKFYGDASKSRFSLAVSDNVEHVDLCCELAEYLQADKMNWRGQFHRSNAAYIFLEGKGGSVDRAKKTINENCFINLMTADGRKGSFYGRGLAGAGVTPPPPPL